MTGLVTLTFPTSTTSENADHPTVVIALPCQEFHVMLFRFWQPRKALSLIVFKFPGNVIKFIDVQFAKPYSPIDSKVLGNVIDFNFLQIAKAPSPIEVKVLGNVTEDSFKQP